jgi:hypothetical protein
MPEANPYAPPVAPITGVGGGGRELFAGLDTKTLKKLRDHSHTIRALGMLWALGTLIYAGLALMMLAGSDAGGAAAAGLLLGLGALVGCASYACFARPGWGRVLGIILNAIALLGFPIGTLIGILGLIAFVGGEKLFGDGKYLHADLQREFKHRKQNKIA